MKLTKLDDLQSWERLLNAGFPVEEGASFFDDFPVWGQDTPEIDRVGIRDEGGRWIAAGGLRECSMIAGVGPDGRDQNHQIGIVGGIVTDPGFRGQGLAGQIVAELLALARKRDLPVVVLFGSVTPLYQRLGFVNFGRQARIPLHSEFKGNITQQLTVTSVYPEGLDRFFLNRTQGLRVMPEDLGWIRAHRHVEWVTAGPADAPEAFAAVGKGIDLQGIVHEVGGSPEAVRQLLNGVAHSSPSCELLANAHLIDVLGIHSTEGVREPIGLGHSLNDRGEQLLKDPASPLWFWGVDGA